MKDFDVILIGAGVCGCAIARELSRYSLRTCVLEAEEDVCCGTSKANSAIVHAGFDAPPGTLMSRLNVEGSRQMERLAKELDFPYRQNGAMVLCLDPKDLPVLMRLQKQGEQNGVQGLRLLSGEEARAIEPNLSDEVSACLFAPTSAILCPFLLTIALAENACANGASFFFDMRVKKIDRDSSGGWIVQSEHDAFHAKIVINAAGVYADEIHNLVSKDPLRIVARRGEYKLMDKEASSFVSHTLFQLPGKMGKGVLLTPTIHGNLLAGPTAEDIADKEGTCTTSSGLDELSRKVALSAKNVPLRQVITSFAGLRAHAVRPDGSEREVHDFIIGEVKDAPNFIDVAGIESPGLSSSPAIGTYVAQLVLSKLPAPEKTSFQSRRTGFLSPFSLSTEDRNALIREQPAYGNLICRCESVTEGEILDAIHRTPGARSLDGVKRRTRAGMGRCQAGFCSPKVMDILQRELQLEMEEVTKSGEGSPLVVGRTKQ